MSEEEIIKQANRYKAMVESESSRNGFDEILIGLLDLYKQKKEYIKENEIYKKNLFDSYEKMEDLYNKEKEKNEELEVKCKMQEYRISVIDERELISKDKIKEIIYPTPTNAIPIEIQESKLYKKILELLGEDNT